MMMKACVLVLTCSVLAASAPVTQKTVRQTATPSNAPNSDSICDGINANLLFNCGFENGDFSFWNFYGDTDYSGVGTTNPFNGAYVPYSGNYGAYFGSVGGQTYLEVGGSFIVRPLHLEFWLANPVGGSPSSFEVQWNGVPLMTLDGTDPFDWQQFIFEFQPDPDGLGVLTFILRHDPDWWNLDDISLTYVTTEEGK